MKSVCLLVCLFLFCFVLFCFFKASPHYKFLLDCANYHDYMGLSELWEIWADWFLLTSLKFFPVVGRLTGIPSNIGLVAKTVISLLGKNKNKNKTTLLQEHTVESKKILYSKTSWQNSDSWVWPLMLTVSRWLPDWKGFHRSLRAETNMGSDGTRLEQINA